MEEYPRDYMQRAYVKNYEGFEILPYVQGNQLACQLSQMCVEDTDPQFRDE